MNFLASHGYKITGLVVFFALSLNFPVYAQGGNGTINGTVTDQTGAVIPGAEVRLKNTLTGQTTVLTTSSEGTFTAPFLALGSYEVNVSHPGFATETQTGLTVSTDQVASVKILLKPGTVNTQVQVSAAAMELDTTTGAISQVIDQHSIVELPLNGRNPAELVYVVPAAVNGVTATTAIRAGGLGGGFPNGQETEASVNGSRMGGVYYMLDGVRHMDTDNQNANPFPNPDATQEFRVITNNFDAQYGFTSGSVVSIATRSGTNQWHGVGFEFLRNNDLNATDFFSHMPIRSSGTSSAGRWAGRSSMTSCSSLETINRQSSTSASPPLPTSCRTITC